MRATRSSRLWGLSLAALSIAASGCGDEASVASSDASRVDVSAVDVSAVDVSADDRAPDAPAVVDAPVAVDVTPPVDAPAAVVIDDRGVPAAAALYTADRMRFGIRDVAGAIEHALAAPGVDNVIVYVHGRGCGGGGEPNKSLAEAMPALARDYTSAPVLLFWPGSDDSCPLGFPEARAREAGPALAVVLGDLYRYRLAHPAASVRYTLLTHSMGSLVLEAATAVSGVSGLPASLFDAALVNAGASAAPDHAAWLARVVFAQAVYSTVNSGDLVLTAAGLGRPTRLGKSVSGARLASGVTYLDFSANDVNHAYYIPSGQSGAAMRALYQRVMNGLAFDFATSTGVGAPERRDGATVQRFNGR